MQAEFYNIFRLLAQATIPGSISYAAKDGASLMTKPWIRLRIHRTHNFTNPQRRANGFPPSFRITRMMRRHNGGSILYNRT